MLRQGEFVEDGPRNFQPCYVKLWFIKMPLVTQKHSLIWDPPGAQSRTIAQKLVTKYISPRIMAALI